MRSVFLAVVALLVAQAVYAYAVQEPYPSFVYPSFQGAPDREGPVHVLRPHLIVRFTDPDQVIEVPYRQLLDPAPGVVADAIVYTVFAPASSDAHPRSTPAQFRLFLEQPTFARGTITLSPTLRDPGTIAWLRNRLAQLHPGTTPQSLEVRWDRHRYVIGNPSIKENVTTVAQFDVPLEG